MKHLGHTDLKHAVYVNHALLPAFKENVIVDVFINANEADWLVL